MTDVKLKMVVDTRGEYGSTGGNISIYIETDHYSAQMLKGSSAILICPQCGIELSTTIPKHADAYHKLDCPGCKKAIYLVLSKIGGQEARCTGYIVVALPKMPDSWKSYMQPDDNFVDPRTVMGQRGLDVRFANDAKAYGRAFAEIQKEIANKRNVDT